MNIAVSGIVVLNRYLFPVNKGLIVSHIIWCPVDLNHMAVNKLFIK